MIKKKSTGILFRRDYGKMDITLTEGFITTNNTTGQFSLLVSVYIS